MSISLTAFVDKLQEQYELDSVEYEPHEFMDEVHIQIGGNEFTVYESGDVDNLVFLPLPLQSDILECIDEAIRDSWSRPTSTLEVYEPEHVWLQWLIVVGVCSGIWYMFN